MVHHYDEYYPASYINFIGDNVNNHQYEKECVNSACPVNCGKSSPCKASENILLSSYGKSEIAAIDETIKRLEGEVSDLQSRRREVINRYSLNKSAPGDLAKC